jgi:hypothetical protein
LSSRPFFFVDNSALCSVQGVANGLNPEGGGGLSSNGRL